jgi:hypothetical protein
LSGQPASADGWKYYRNGRPGGGGQILGISVSGDKLRSLTYTEGTGGSLSCFRGTYLGSWDKGRAWRGWVGTRWSWDDAGRKSSTKGEQLWLTFKPAGPRITADQFGRGENLLFRKVSAKNKTKYAQYCV